LRDYPFRNFILEHFITIIQDVLIHAGQQTGEHHQKRHPCDWYALSLCLPPTQSHRCWETAYFGWFERL